MDKDERLTFLAGMALLGLTIGRPGVSLSGLPAQAVKIAAQTARQLDEVEPDWGKP